MRTVMGYPLPLGVSVKGDMVNFSVAVETEKTCHLCIFKAGNEKPKYKIELPKNNAIGAVRFVALTRCNLEGMEYLYDIDGEYVVDPYARGTVETEGHMRGRILTEEYDWEGDQPLCIPCHEVISYNLHVRGFTKHSSSQAQHKGTFEGVVEKIPYLKELGINQIQCMPVYAFEDAKQYKNYWGYGEAFCFAIKQDYAAEEQAEISLKNMVKACHRNGIEVILHLPFSQATPKQMIEECLRYYVLDFHVDGFVLNPYLAPMEGILSDPILKKTKILQYRDDFQNTMRSFLRGDEGMVPDAMWWLKQHSGDEGSCNYISNHTGFTLADLVTYNEKHNEANGENNTDGPENNYSWNCGVEGPTRRKQVIELRNRQMRNAMFLMILSQGTPCILAGDEFGNSQQGNNNVYCQDNETAWLDWGNLEKNNSFFEYTKQLIALRKAYPILHSDKPLLGVDKTSCGIPDISYHGKEAWQLPEQNESCQFGVYYHDVDGTDCYIAYNMSEQKQEFALPALIQKKKWHKVFTTANERGITTGEVENQRATIVDGRTIVMLMGR